MGFNLAFKGLIGNSPGRRRPTMAVSSKPKCCTLFFMMFYIKKIVQTGKCFGFKQWQLLSTGNSFSCGLVGCGS